MKSYFFNAVKTTDLETYPSGYDREYDADDHAAFFSRFFSEAGVFSGTDADACKVQVQSGATLRVNAGAVYIRGRMAVFDGTETIAVTQDCKIVVRLDKSLAVRDFQLLAVTELTRTEDVYDLELAAVALAAVVGGHEARVTDTRTFLSYMGQPAYYPPDSDSLPYVLWLYALGFPMTAEQRALVEGNPSLMGVYRDSLGASRSSTVVFSVSDWVSADGRYKLTLARSLHGRYSAAFGYTMRHQVGGAPEGQHLGGPVYRRGVRRRHGGYHADLRRRLSRRCYLLRGMTPLEEARERRSTLWARCKEAKTAMLEARDPAERRRQKERQKVLQAMYKEACEEVNRLDPDYVPPRAKTTRTGAPEGTGLDVLLQSGTFWSDLDGSTWSKLEGASWGAVEAAGRGAKILQKAVIDALTKKCTDMQREYIRAYYADGCTVREIGEEHGRAPSTISRTIRRGLRSIEQYVTAKLLLSKCIDQQGKFDYLKFCNSSQLLTDRQKEMVYLLLSRDTSYTDMAVYIDRNKTTAWRTSERAEQRLAGLGVDLDLDLSAVTIDRSDWADKSEKELAEDLGLSPRFYYCVIRRNEKVDGVLLYHLVILRRLRETGDMETVARELRCTEKYLRNVARRYEGTALPAVEIEPYRPKEPKRVSLPENPFVLVSDGTLVDRIDSATAQALRKRYLEGAAC